MQCQPSPAPVSSARAPRFASVPGTAIAAGCAAGPVAALVQARSLEIIKFQGKLWPRVGLAAAESGLAAAERAALRALRALRAHRFSF